MTAISNEERRDAEQLLPFLANDTLEGEERRRVEDAVAADPGLAAELEALKRLRQGVRAQPVGRSPGALGLARVMREIDRAAPEQSADAPVAAAPSAAAPVSIIGGSVSPLWRIAAVVALGLFAGSLFLERGAPGPGPELAGEGAVLDRPVLVLGFKPTATEAALRALLLELELELVSGPSAIGLYRVAATDDAAAERALTRLRTASDLIETVERE